jgi:hypothetical protein
MDIVCVFGNSVCVYKTNNIILQIISMSVYTQILSLCIITGNYPPVHYTNAQYSHCIIHTRLMDYIHTMNMYGDR